MKLFVDFVEKELNYNNMDLEFSPSEQLTTPSGETCNGYFSPQQRKIVIAIGNKSQHSWLSILIHEFAHYTQYKRDTQIWKNFKKVSDSGLSLFNWINGKEYSLSELVKIFSTTIELEWECEQIAIELIKEHGLPIDLIFYTKGANAYLYSFSWIYKHRKWIGGKNAAYLNKEIFDLMPEELQNNYLNMENGFVEVFDTTY